MVRFSPAYPTPEHELAARRIVSFFSRQAHVGAVLLTCSCARGRGSRDSCLDMCILVPPDVTPAQRHELEQAWNAYHASEDAFKALIKVGRYSHVDLEFSDGRFAPHGHDWTSGADEFELEIGNIVAYSVTLWEHGEYLKQLQARWLPFYDEATRRERLAMVLRYCRNNLDHIPLYVERELYFQSFRRLYNAFGEFLQALFIARRTYPIAYDKWMREQIVDILGLPELYPQLTSLLEIHHFESREIADRAAALRHLVETYIDQ